jgi:glycerophosphoryl diester phosphodiesterase
MPDGIGPNTRLVIPAKGRWDAAAADRSCRAGARAGTARARLDAAQRPVFPVTVLPRRSRRRVYRRFRDLGVDGIFTDFADAAARR